MLDIQSIAVVLDVDALSAEEVLEILSGGWQGIYSAGDKYYFSAEFIKTGEMLADRIRGGTLTLGGANNGNGVLKILNASGTQIGKWDKDGISATNGVFKGTLDGGKIIGSTVTGSTVKSQKANSQSYSQMSGGYLYFYTDPSEITAGSTYCGRIGPGIYSRAVSSDTVTYEEDYAALEYYSPKAHFFRGDIYAWNSLLCVDSLRTKGTAYCGGLASGGFKSRVVDTQNYNVRSQYCYEMPSPMFGDIGGGITDENGECIVELDDIFLETAAANIEYHVFLQKEGQGDLWVASKESAYFVVKGTPNLKFSWEVKMIQRDYEYERLEEYPNTYEPMQDIKDEIDKTESLYEDEINQILVEEERLLYEES